MDKLKLTIDGYKCFDKKHEFNFNNITLLTGANSAGKSSVIQSLLLAKIVSEAIMDNPELEKIPLPLKNDKYAMDLGYFYDISNNNRDVYDINISLQGISFGAKEEDNEEDSNDVYFTINASNRLLLKKVFLQGFTYLCADRMAPHYEYEYIKDSNICDCHGKNTGDIINNNDFLFKTDSYRSIKFTDDIKLRRQLNEWIDYIFPGVEIELEKGDKTYKIKDHDNAATNIGFGITYALPILVSGLTVPEGGILIVENPEAHLHAKAQSNMGYFLARMAAAGVRVIIETHSEHIVNGIRRMIVEGKTKMSHEDMTIYFFQNKNGEKNIMEFGMDKWGNLDEFPVDFFDQVRQDMFELTKFGRKRIEHHEG